jgi:hypothetical protein
MFVSEDGTVTGSIDHSKLPDVEPKTDEAKAQVQTLLDERAAGEAVVAAEQARLAAAADAQNPALSLDYQIEQQQARLDELKARREQVDDDGKPAARTTQAAPQATQSADAGGSDAELDQLRKQAAEAGVTVDNRWGADRLRQETAAAQSAAASRKAR